MSSQKITYASAQQLVYDILFPCSIYANLHPYFSR